MFSFLSDRAARRFGIFFLSTLAVMTIGAGVGIGVGNIAHYRELNFLSTRYFIQHIFVGYFGPNNNTNLSSGQVYNLTFREAFIGMNTLLSLSSTKHLKKRESSQLWLSMEPSPNENEYDRH